MLHYEDTLVEVHRVVVGPVDNNVHVVRCRQTRRRRAHRRRQRARAAAPAVPGPRGAQGHRDPRPLGPHPGRARRSATPGYEVAVTAADAEMLPSYDLLLEDDAVIEVGRLRLRTIATPGHTPGSICFAVEGTPLLFSGDTLFPGGPGRTKFPGGDFPTIIRSIEDRIFAPLRRRHRWCSPATATDTTIGAERPHLQEWVDRGW